MRPNCTDVTRLMTQPAWLTHVNRRQNPRNYRRAYGNYWPQPNGIAVGITVKACDAVPHNCRGIDEA